MVFVHGADDWEGMYVDGVLRLEGHRLDADDVARKLGADVLRVQADGEWLASHGSLPSLLKDVELEVKR